MIKFTDRLTKPIMVGYRKYNRHMKSHQEISRVLKYIIFFVNFVFWICGIVCIGLGIYLYSNDFRPVLQAIDFFLNPSILLLLAGCMIFLISFLGCTGALREHVCMLKLFALALFLAYICLVILCFIVFILFYSDSKTGISITTVLQNAVVGYSDNKNLADLMDAVQLQLACCGAGSLGYKDWNTNSLYNCSKINSSPERCGVPYSCCKRTENQADLPVVVCGFNAQEKNIAELQNVINVDGCVQPLQKAFEGHAVIIGVVIGAIIVPVCMSVTFSNLLAKQIQRQHYLLDKEARKEERRRKKKPSHDNGLREQNLPATVRQDDETRRKVSNGQVPTRRGSEDILNQPSGRKGSADILTFSGSAVLQTDPKEYRRKPKGSGPPKRAARRRDQNGAEGKGRIRPTSAGPAGHGDPKKRKRRAKSQDPNVTLEHAKERRKSSSDELDRVQIENRVNQELERVRTPVPE